MIDFHSHILPKIDDGSHSVQESVEMIHRESEQAIKCIVATPHFYASKDSIEPFLERRKSSLQQLQEALQDDECAPRLYIGAEVAYFSGMGKADLLHHLCIEGTSVLLLEMPFCQWDTEILKDVERIVEKQKLTVMLAHIERYVEFQKKRETWNEIFQMPLYSQMNAGCFLNWKKRRMAFRLLKEIPDIVLGSDCHNLSQRPPNLLEGRTVIRQRAGEARLTAVDELGERILQP